MTRAVKIAQKSNLKMKTFKLSIVVLSLLIIKVTAVAQEAAGMKTISLKKGQVFDLLLLNTRTGVEEKRKAYFDEVFPMATAGGYNYIPGYKVTETPTQGNYYPDFLALASWNSHADMTQTMKKIKDGVADFDQRRREIWSTFNITHFTMTEDIIFTTDPGKCQVVTMYWRKSDKSFNAFKKSWLEEAKKKGADVKFVLTGGESPMQYYHNPDVVFLTEWDDKNTFDQFLATYSEMDHSGILKVNEFIVK